MLERLFTSKTRIKLLNLLFFNQDKEYHLREIARIIKTSPTYVSKELENLINLNIVTKLKKAKFKKVSDPIRLMLEVDKVTQEQLTIVFKFLDSQEGNFWKPIILSTEKLRKNFNQLILKSKTKNGTAKRNRTHDEVVKSAMESEVGKNFSY